MSQERHNQFHTARDSQPVGCKEIDSAVTTTRQVSAWSKL